MKDQLFRAKQILYEVKFHKHLDLLTGNMSQCRVAVCYVKNANCDIFRILIYTLQAYSTNQQFMSLISKNLWPRINEQQCNTTIFLGSFWDN